jgi:hypothetical protein
MEDDREEKAVLSMGVAAGACGALQTLSANDPRQKSVVGGWEVGDDDLREHRAQLGEELEGEYSCT